MAEIPKPAKADKKMTYPTSARLEITDPAEISRYGLRLSEADIEDLRLFEETLIAEEQKLGTLRFG